MKPTAIDAFHAAQSPGDKAICEALQAAIEIGLPAAESRIWHLHPVCFLNENPTVGYSKLEGCIRLMFWSEDEFDEQALKPGTDKFKDAAIRYSHVDQIRDADIVRWLEKSRQIQWDYKNIPKRKGRLERAI